MDASIIIPSFNTQDTIGNTLKHLVQNQHAETSFEIIIVDCSSHDEVKEISTQYPHVKFHKEKNRFNPGKGRNIGARLATGKLLIFIDADIQVAPNAIKQAVTHHHNGSKIFGAALELNLDTSIGAPSYLEHYFFNHESQKSRPPKERNNLSSAFMCFDKEEFMQSGGFKDIPRMQDTELTERLKAGGKKLIFAPDIIGYQTQDSPLRKVFRKIFINGQNLYFIRYQAQYNRVQKSILFILLPALALAKAARIIGRNLKYQSNQERIRTLGITPLITIGALFWMVGIYHSMILGKGINTKRD